jgi:hypothetical protein
VLRAELMPPSPGCRVATRGTRWQSYRGWEYRGVQLGVAGRSTARVLLADQGLQQLVACLHCACTCISAFSHHTHSYTCLPMILHSHHRARALPTRHAQTPHDCRQRKVHTSLTHHQPKQTKQKLAWVT